MALSFRRRQLLRLQERQQYQPAGRRRNRQQSMAITAYSFLIIAALLPQVPALSASPVLTASGGSNNYGLYTNTGSNSIGGVSASGNITLVDDSMNLATTTSIQTSGNLSIHPYTAGTSVSFGGSTSTLNLTDTYLGYMNLGSVNSLSIGDSSNTGALTINSALSYSKPITFITSSGNDIAISCKLTDSALAWYCCCCSTPGIPLPTAMAARPLT